MQSEDSLDVTSNVVTWTSSVNDLSVIDCEFVFLKASPHQLMLG